MWRTVQPISQTPVTAIVSCLTVLAGLSGWLQSVLEVHLQQPFGIIQLLSCHLTHWSWEHLFWDLGMFAVVGRLCEKATPRAYYVALLSSGLCIPAGVMLSNPEIDVYRGLSGIDTALFALLASRAMLRGWARSERSSVVTFGCLLGLLWCKIGFEFYSGSVLFVQQPNFLPLPMAHAVGAILGSVVALIYRFDFGKSPD